MTLLLPDPRPPVRLHHLQAELDERRGVIALGGLGGMDPDAAQVLGADEPVLTRADESDRRAMVTVEGAAIETVGDEHVVCQRVFDGDDRLVAVEAAEGDVGDPSRPALAPARSPCGRRFRRLTPSQCRSVADHPATQWKSAVSSRRGSVASSATGSAKGLATAPLISIAGSLGTSGGGWWKCAPKRGNPSTARWPGGSVTPAGSAAMSSWWPPPISVPCLAASADTR